MQSPIVQTLIHVAKVAGHILVAIIFVGALAYLSNDQATFTAYLVSFGLPTAVANLLFAGIYKFIQLHQPNPNAN